MHQSICSYVLQQHRRVYLTTQRHCRVSREAKLFFSATMHTPASSANAGGGKFCCPGEIDSDYYGSFWPWGFFPPRTRLSVPCQRLYLIGNKNRRKELQNSLAMLMLDGRISFPYQRQMIKQASQTLPSSFQLCVIALYFFVFCKSGSMYDSLQHVDLYEGVCFQSMFASVGPCSVQRHAFQTKPIEQQLIK